eukprot:scaffold36097_cov73-Phaeocystis_antarctica.AAC.2
MATPQQTSTADWVCEIDGKWVMYDVITTILLEVNHTSHKNVQPSATFQPRAGFTHSPCFEVGKHKYQVNYSTMEQVNLKTQVRRTVARAPRQNGTVAANPATAAWAECPFAWPLWPGHINHASPSGNPFLGRSTLSSSKTPNRQCSDTVDPPWPPGPPPDAPVMVSYDEVLQKCVPGSPEVRFWQTSLAQCVAPDGRKRSYSLSKVPEDSEEMTAVKHHWEVTRENGSAVLSSAPSAALWAAAARQPLPSSPAAASWAAAAGQPLQSRYSVVGCYRLQSVQQLHRFQNRRDEMARLLVNDGLSPDLLQMGFYWHGTGSYQALEGIVQDGFDRFYAAEGNNHYGVGTYFAKCCEFSAENYKAEIFDVSCERAKFALLLCAVLFDETARGEKGRFPPPKKPAGRSRTGARYNTTGDCDYPDPTRPTSTCIRAEEPPKVLVTYSDGQALPLYIVTFE